MPRLSIIIIASERVESLEQTLASVLQNRPAACEIIVVHPSSYDDPYQLRDEVRFVAVPPSASLVESMNAAVNAAEAEILHFLRDSIEVEEGWTDQPLCQFDKPKVGSVIPMVLNSNRGAQITLAGVTAAQHGSRIECRGTLNDGPPNLGKHQPAGPSLAAAFYRASIVGSLGGFDAAVGDELADLELALSMRRLGFETVLAPDSRLFLHDQAWQTKIGGFQAGKFAERLYRRHLAGGMGARSLLLHAADVAAELARGGFTPSAAMRSIGRVAEMYNRSDRRHFHERLRRAADANGISDDNSTQNEVIRIPDKQPQRLTQTRRPRAA